MLIFFPTSSLRAAPTVVPNVKQDTNVTYYDNSTNKIKSEVFKAPVAKFDDAPVQPLLASPIEASRLIAGLPNFGLAKWHWWLFGTMLAQAQRQYADCVGRIRQAQELLGELPIDNPANPLYPTVNTVREYTVPFEPIQNFYSLTRPPSLEEAKAHAEAALATYNLTVYHIGFCEQTAAGYKAKIKSKMKR